MAKTYEPIATTTLGSNTATVDFTGISQAYTDLILVIDDSTSDVLIKRAPGLLINVTT
jgi:hypothetical protein